jgi:methylene-tetrahydromethanopterin dehydrogenase
MEKVSILHLLTAAKNASPFDVNMAYDAGFDKIMPYTSVALDEVAGLTQDVIFSRSSSGLKREAIFIGGRDIDLAMDMLQVSQKATFAALQVSILADPSGAFTTAAAMVAKVDFHLNHRFKKNLEGNKIAVFGATGPVGGCVAVIAAKQGAQVQLIAHNSMESAREKAQNYNARYSVNISVVDGTTEAAKQAILDGTDIALSCAAAGVRVISAQQIAHSKRLKIIADVNAVPPSGAEDVNVTMDGIEIAGTYVLGIGALAIGNLKYNTQHQLLKQILSADKPCYLEFMAAFETAQKLVRG